MLSKLSKLVMIHAGPFTGRVVWIAVRQSGMALIDLNYHRDRPPKPDEIRWVPLRNLRDLVAMEYIAACA